MSDRRADDGPRRLVEAGRFGGMGGGRDHLCRGLLPLDASRFDGLNYRDQRDWSARHDTMLAQCPADPRLLRECGHGPVGARLE